MPLVEIVLSVSYWSPYWSMVASVVLCFFPHRRVNPVGVAAENTLAL